MGKIRLIIGRFGIITRVSLIVWVLWALAGFYFLRQAAAESKVFSFYWENDVFTGTDQDYSNGLKLGWSKPYTSNASDERSFTDKVIEKLPGVNNPDAQRVSFFALGQNIYTPKDTKTSDLIEDDRPYAGLSYVSFGIHSDQGRQRCLWEFELGVVGPWSLAEETQNAVHDAIKTSRAAGWEHQLNNEPALGAVFETKWRLGRLNLGDAFGLELISHMGGCAGNIAVYANAGGEVRFGWHLPDNFGTCPIRPGCDVGNLVDIKGQPVQKNRWSTHFFVAVDCKAVLHDIFLDGNTFQESHSVDKEPFVADLMTGVAIQFKSLQLSYAYIHRTKEFEQQDSSHAFGAVKVSYFY
jgi:lipid A 3-O-deacylase